MVESGVESIRQVVPQVLKHLDPLSIESISDAISESIDLQGMRFVAIQAFHEPSTHEPSTLTATNEGFNARQETERGIASAYLLEYPGKLASLVGPSLASNSRMGGSHPEAERAILVALVNRARAWGVELVQAVVDDDSPFPPRPLREAGFSKLSILHQMAVDLPNVVASRDLTRASSRSALNWRRYAPVDKEVWIDWMDATYEQTADCPELNGLRTTSKTLEGYLASAGTAKVGNPAPEWWGGFEAEPGSGVSGGRPKIAAAFMLGDSGGRFWELSYMGVAPSHRGRRLGNETLYRALTRAQELNARRLTLAVDCRNTYAMRLYREYGFQRIRQLEAWFLAFRK